MCVIATFCQIDDFCKLFHKTNSKRTIGRQRERKMSTSEMLTILVAFHQMNHRNFKTFYMQFVAVYWKHYFPDLYSYSRFVYLMPEALSTLTAFLDWQSKNK